MPGRSDNDAKDAIWRVQAAMRLAPTDSSCGQLSFLLASQLLRSHVGRDEERLLVVGHGGSGEQRRTLQLIRILLAVSTEVQGRGGVLLHGALAERDGNGVVLAGPGGVGKTTLSGRLAPPWNSLSDDATLVVRDPEGAYWAHPWPTWSQFVTDGPGGSWDVQRAVRLRGIFFLNRAEQDHAEVVGSGHAVALLIESAEQAWWGMTPHMSAEEKRASRLQRLDNICALARAVPTYILRFIATGAFWREIERVLGWEETAA